MTTKPRTRKRPLSLTAAAARVRKLAQKFNAIQDNFEDKEQEYLNYLMVNICCGDPEPPRP